MVFSRARARFGFRLRAEIRSRPRRPAIPASGPLFRALRAYPDRILPRDGFEKQLAARTLTKLYNERPAWLAQAHEALDVAVAAAYGWPDYTPQMPDEEILRRLLALNRERADLKLPRGDTLAGQATNN